MKEFKGTQGDWVVSQEHPLSGKPGYEHYRILKSGKGFLDIDLQGFGLAGFINERDANLMAAAPNLLEALQCSIYHLREQAKLDAHAFGVLQAASHAIAKALGESK